MQLVLWGTILVLLGWLIQFSAAVSGKKQIQSYFLLLYSVGYLMIVIESLEGGFTTGALLNIAILFLALLVWFKSK